MFYNINSLLNYKTWFWHFIGKAIETLKKSRYIWAVYLSLKFLLVNKSIRWLFQFLSSNQKRKPVIVCWIFYQLLSSVFTISICLHMKPYRCIYICMTHLYRNIIHVAKYVHHSRCPSGFGQITDMSLSNIFFQSSIEETLRNKRTMMVMIHSPLNEKTAYINSSQNSLCGSQ